jgi:hypothetical protein
MSDQASGNSVEQARKFSWNTHYLLTRAALGSLNDEFLGREIPVKSLQDFVDSAGKALPDVMERYLALLARKTGIEPGPDNRRPDIRTPHDLIHALRLNPDRPIHYCRVVSPEGTTPHTLHDPSRQGPPGGAYIEAGIDERMSVREVLSVYADEPDWGMDQDLFAIESYGLGRPPFGGETGKSSQASFHMAFFHEIPLLVRIYPRVEKTFLDLRAHVFLALARLALDRSVDYWAWRFTAWAAHYLQDLTQPYHAKALPFSGWAVLGRFLRNPRAGNFLEKNKNLLMNRHILFEAAVHLLLNEAAKKSPEHPFFAALEGKGECAAGTLPMVLRESSKVAAKKAFRVNRMLEVVLDDPQLSDPQYFVGDDPSYPLEKKLETASAHRPQAVQEFWDMVGACLVQTGKITRYVVREVGAPG